MSRPYRANIIGCIKPRALPWADMSCIFSASEGNLITQGFHILSMVKIRIADTSIE